MDYQKIAREIFTANAFSNSVAVKAQGHSPEIGTNVYTVEGDQNYFMFTATELRTAEHQTGIVINKGQWWDQ